MTMVNQKHFTTFFSHDSKLKWYIPMTLKSYLWIAQPVYVQIAQLDLGEGDATCSSCGEKAFRYLPNNIIEMNKQNSIFAHFAKAAWAVFDGVKKCYSSGAQCTSYIHLNK